MRDRDSQSSLFPPDPDSDVGRRLDRSPLSVAGVPADVAVHVPHRHPERLTVCSDARHHAGAGRPCPFCGGAACRLPLPAAPDWQ